MSHLLRSHAPVTEAAWAAVDEEARRQLTGALAARKLVDFEGPRGWEHSATNLGRTRAVDGPAPEGLEAAQRQVLPLVELRARFVLSKEELLNADRGAEDVDFTALDEAARRLARAENVAVLHGWPGAGVTGVAGASPHGPVPLGGDYTAYPATVARAVEVLRSAGVAGPYGLALGPEGYTGVVETTEHGGLVVFDHLRQILEGPIVWAPGVEGAVVLSLRGGDFLFDCGQDLSVGYDHHDADALHLYLEETFSFRVASPEAAVALVP
jgi:uncharacterized linocin/CFP29 family protein